MTGVKMFSEEIFDLNLPGNLDVGNIQDEDLRNAHEEALASNSITPLLKQELRYKIQSRRLNEGKDEMCVTQSRDTAKTYQLTSAELEKRSRRREQNRHAAKRFRQKKKEEEASHLQEIAILEAKNTALRAKLESLVQERNKLLLFLSDHVIKCVETSPARSHASPM